MKVRERQATGVTTAVVSNGNEAVLERSPHFSWEDWFRHASAAQRAEALNLARQQGVVYPHQLPPTTNGLKPAPTAVKDTEASLAITRLLGNAGDSLKRLQFEPITFFDCDLDVLQREAVARAIATPDLFLLQGLPGSGKSRVLVEILLQSAVRGERILFLAAQTASLDVVLQRLAGRSEVFPIRILDTHEKPESLSPNIAALSIEKQQRAFVERTLADARAKHGEADAACRTRRQQEPLWEELHAALQRWNLVGVHLQSLEDKAHQLREIVVTDAVGEFCQRKTDRKQFHEKELASLTASLKHQQDIVAQREQDVGKLSAEIGAKESAYLAKKHGKFWTLAYWTNLFNSQLITDYETALSEQQQAKTSRQEAASEIDRLTSEMNRKRAEFDQESASLLDAEIENRKQELFKQSAKLKSERDQIETDWNAILVRLDVGAVERTTESLESAQQAWQARKKSDEQQCLFAHGWCKFVEETGPQLATRVAGFANVLAGTVSRWHVDAKFRESAGSSVDLLIIEDAEALTEAELLKLARLAPRCVLVAQALAEPSAAPAEPERTVRPLFGAPAVVAPCWQRLWQAVGGDAGRWPCHWRREKGRLVCQLIPMSIEDHQHLESETLADAQDIELRMLQRPRTRPALAQVIFAPQHTFADAFTFMVREVQEFPLEPIGGSFWWSESDAGLIRHLGPCSEPISARLDIEPGFRLGAVADEHGDPTRGVCLEFDKTAGWDRAKAEAWLYRLRPVRDHERAVFLQSSHRFEKSLASLTHAILRPGHGHAGPAPDLSCQFIAVPVISNTDWPREGAGQEIDLSASRNGDRLPAGLRHGLPSRGFVNYSEAQALIRRLEQAAKSLANECRVAVLGLYEGQVELLRRLVQQSEILRSRRFLLEVALPSRLHQRECDIAFVSLTRSHATRPVSFGEDVRELPIALTRARQHLYVFGDPGTLARRVASPGPLDHLDAQSAQQEWLRLSRLLAIWQQHGRTLPHANGKDKTL